MAGRARARAGCRRRIAILERFTLVLGRVALAALARLLPVLASGRPWPYGIYFRILAAAGATNLLLVTLLIPVSALLLGMTLLDERLAPGHLAGMAPIALGLGAINGRPLARLTRLRRPAPPDAAQLRP